MTLEQAIEWLCTHSGKIEFKRLPNHNITGLEISAKSVIVDCCWTNKEQNVSRSSLPIEKIIELVEELDHNIGS